MNGDAGSVEEALSGGDVHELLRVWEDFNRGETWREVSALEALRANTKAVELLTGRRWYVIRSSREAGATWTQVGEALGITKQAAHDFYRRRIEEQEKYPPDFHDAAAARAVLEDVKED
jgi:hypothetical protein